MKENARVIKAAGRMGGEYEIRLHRCWKINPCYVSSGMYCLYSCRKLEYEPDMQASV